MYPYYNGINTQIVRVNGENGARAYALAPNCSALLLDNTAPLVWLVQTDGAGYKTVTPFKIEAHTVPQAHGIEELAARLEKLEGLINEKSNTANATAKQAKRKCDISTDDEQ